MSFESKLSYTGTWGEERLNESKSKDNFKSTYSLTFNPESLQTIKDSEDNEFAKFVSLLYYFMGPHLSLYILAYWYKLRTYRKL